jgi:phosphatidylserine synthase
MGESRKATLIMEAGTPTSFKERLADLLTLSRGITGLAILALSFVGPDAYLAVVVLVLIGAATDILDGIAARRYLGKDREGKLGKYDLEVDTIFVLCTLGYLSLSNIVIPTAIGLSWIGLAVIVVLLYKRKPKVLLLFEIPTVVALLVIAGVYNLEIFTLIVAPAMIIGLIINRKRVLYLIFEYWPRVFSE